jgi:drug/metabolite transporter (DMT)-like permease
MRLPPSYIAAGPAIASRASAPGNGVLWIFSNKGGYDESWSSLIGIITAIVGNVLISFALNMQRYAHIRLDREWQEKERQRKKRCASGTSLSRLADEEGSKNDGLTKYHSPRSSEHIEGQPRELIEASENDPLISQSPSQTQTRPSLGSEDSDSSGQEEEYKQKSYLKSPYWWAGIILMTIGEAGNFLAYGFAPASIVSPLGVVALISNCIIAPFMLKEPFRKRDALGVVIAVGGAVTVVLSANDDNPKLGPGEIWKLISTWEFETYLGITVGVIALLMVASNRYGDKNILIDLGLVGLFGMCGNSVLVHVEILTYVKGGTRPYLQKVLRLYYPTLSGVSLPFQCSTYCSLFWLALLSCRSSTSIEHCNASMLHRSSLYNLSSLHSLSFLGPQSCIAISNAHQATMQASSLVVAP